jgi:DNA invertase Pin-like site-specific DNA recombinase
LCARAKSAILEVWDSVGLSNWTRSLNDTWPDTTTAHGRLMLTVLGGLAEFERELIRARTGEGRGRAVANGVRLGRKRALSHHQQLSAAQALEILGINAEATEQEIRAAYNRLMKRVHPDVGGSEFFPSS